MVGAVQFRCLLKTKDTNALIFSFNWSLIEPWILKGFFSANCGIVGSPTRTLIIPNDFVAFEVFISQFRPDDANGFALLLWVFG
jgi:hypothetical protein